MMPGVPEALSFAISLFVVLAALSIAPAQLAARSLLRQVSGPQTSRARAPALVVGFGVGAGIAVFLSGTFMGAQATLAVACLTLLVLLSVVDLAWRWLPLEWCGLLALCGLTNAVLSGTFPDAMLGALLGGGLLLALRTAYLVLRNIEALGLGDVWLAAAIGTLVGPDYIIWLLGTAACLGILLSFWAARREAARAGVAFGAHLSAVTPFFLVL